jgi:hypothetical protein
MISLQDKIIQRVPNDYRLLVGILLISIGIPLVFIIIGIFFIDLGCKIFKSHRPESGMDVTNQPLTSIGSSTSSIRSPLGRINSILLFLTSKSLWNIVWGMFVFLLSLYVFCRPSSSLSHSISGEISFSLSKSLSENLTTLYILFNHPAMTYTASLVGMILSVYLITKRKSFFDETLPNAILVFALGVIFLALPLIMTEYCLSSGGGGCEGASIFIIFTLPAGLCCLTLGLSGVIKSITKRY